MNRPTGIEMIEAHSVISSVPTIAWKTPPASAPPMMPDMSSVQNAKVVGLAAITRVRPREITDHSSDSNGNIEIANAPMTSRVMSRSVAQRGPSRRSE